MTLGVDEIGHTGEFFCR